MNIRQPFSQRLRQRRTELKISQTDLALAIGVHRTSIGAYEDGKRTPTLDALALMVEVLQVNPLWLLGMSDANELYDSVPVYQIPTPATPLITDNNKVSEEAVMASGNIDFCIIVKDNAMEGIRLLAGDLVCISHQQPPVSGDVVAIDHPEMGVMIRRLIIRKQENKVVLHAENMHVANLVIPLEQWHDEWILGRVVYSRMSEIY